MDAAAESTRTRTRLESATIPYELVKWFRQTKPMVYRVELWKGHSVARSALLAYNHYDFGQKIRRRMGVTDIKLRYIQSGTVTAEDQEGCALVIMRIFD